MKKFLAILLISVMVMSLTVNFSFADEVSEEEKAEILNSADEAIRVYECLTGSCLDNGILYSTPLEFITTYETDDFEYPTKDYTKTTLSMTKSDEYYELIDKYFINYDLGEDAWIFVDTKQENKIENGNLIIEGDIRHKLPIAIIHDGTLYVENHVGLAYTVCCYGDVKNGEIVSYNGEKAVIEYNIVDGVESAGKGVGILYEGVTAELTKTDEGWKISGGTCLSEYFGNHMGNNWYYKQPETGENTVLYIAIAGAAVVCMTALLVRKKREIV